MFVIAVADKRRMCLQRGLDTLKILNHIDDHERQTFTVQLRCSVFKKKKLFTATTSLRN